MSSFLSLRLPPTRLALLGLLVATLGCTSSVSSPEPSSAPAAPVAVDSAAITDDNRAPSEQSTSEPPSAETDSAEADSVDWVARQLRDMTLDEKIAQLFMIRLDGHFQNAHTPSYRETVSLVKEFGAGGMMFGPGRPMTQVTVANDLQRAAERPLLVSQDTEWGVGMRIGPHIQHLRCTLNRRQ